MAETKMNKKHCSAVRLRASIRLKCNFIFTIEKIPFFPTKSATFSSNVFWSRYLSLPLTRQDLTQGQWPEGRLKWGWEESEVGHEPVTMMYLAHPKVAQPNRGPYGLKSAFTGQSSLESRFDPNTTIKKGSRLRDFERRSSSVSFERSTNEARIPTLPQIAHSLPTHVTYRATIPNQPLKNDLHPLSSWPVIWWNKNIRISPGIPIFIYLK